MLPVKEPRDELRVEPAKKRTHTDKYVTVIETGTNSTEVDFNSQSLLPMSASHYKVGVDELVVSLSNLSIVEVDNTVMFEIRPMLRNNVANQGVAEQHMGLFAAASQQDFQFKCNRVYRNSLDVNERLGEIGRAVRQFMVTNGCLQQAANAGVSPIMDWVRNTDAAAMGNLVDNNDKDIEISLSGNGQLRIKAPLIFWTNFYIYIPQRKYMSIILGSATRDVICVHPVDKTTAIQTIEDIVTRTATHFNNVPHLNVTAAHTIGNAAGNIPDDVFTFQTSSSFLTNLNRIVSIELSSSLIDHQSLSYTIPAAEGLSRGEVPDYALGRFLVNFQPKISKVSEADGFILETTIGPVKLASTDQRICYHHLRPQERITQMRMKLWARVRKYSEATDKWYMKTIMCPVGPMDFWCAKLHFTAKKDHQY